MNNLTQKALKAYEKTEHTEIDILCENCGYNKEEHGPLSGKCPHYTGDLKLGYKDYSCYKTKVDWFFKEIYMLIPYLYHCPEKLKGILHYDENENLFFVFGDRYISLDRVRSLVELRIDELIASKED